MKNTVLYSLRNIAVLMMTSLLGLGLLTLAFCLPVNRQHADDAFLLLESEGWYPNVGVTTSSLATLFHSFLPGVLDDSSERIIVRTATWDSAETTPLEQAIYMYNEWQGESYFRYWHGYVVFLRPLLYLMDYSSLRMWNLLLQFLLTGVVARLFGKRCGIRYEIAVWAAYLLLMPVALGYNFQFSSMYYLALVGSAVFLRKNEKTEQPAFYSLVFLLLGAFSSYLDLLTYPLITFGMPAVFMICMAKENSGRKPLFRVIESGIWWILGYGGMWTMKMVLGTLITGENLFVLALEKAGHWSGTGEEALTFADRWKAVYVNWQHYGFSVYMVILLAGMGWILFRSLRKGRSGDPKVPALTLIALAPFVWYLVMANHVAAHHFFTYRVFNAGILATGVAGICLTESRDGQGDKKSAKQTLVFWLVGLVCGGLLFCTNRITYTALNTDNVENEAVRITEQGMEFPFIPEASRITELLLCGSAENAEGSIYVALFDGNRELYEESFPAKEWFAQSSYSFTPDWRLKKGKAYVLQVRTEGTQGETSLLTLNTENGSRALAEFGDAVQQPLVIIKYSSIPREKDMLLLTVCGWAVLVFEILSSLAILFARRQKETA